MFALKKTTALEGQKTWGGLIESNKKKIVVVLNINEFKKQKQTEGKFAKCECWDELYSFLVSLSFNGDNIFHQ